MMAPATVEELKYLDRLVAVEPTWQNYDRRALRRASLDQWVNTAQDCLEAGRLAGKGYWLKESAYIVARSLLSTPAGDPEEYQLHLRLAENLSAAMPEDRDHHVSVAIALYRLGRYDDAILRLEPLLRERNRAIISQMGRFFLLAPWPEPLFLAPWPEPLVEKGQVPLDYSVRAIAYWAMTHQRLGHLDLARAALKDLRKMASSGSEKQSLIREAETLIEGKPRSDK